MPLGDITTDAMRTAFAQYAETHEAASIQRCWSTWNVLCTFLYTGELLTANPMQVVGRPKLANRSQGPPRTAVEALLEAVAHGQEPPSSTSRVRAARNAACPSRPKCSQ
jgi:integrase/recombinase XerC